MRRANEDPGGARQTRNVLRGEGRYVRQDGGPGQYGHCVLELEPLPNGSGFAFESRITAGAIPSEYLKPIEAGVADAMRQGVLAGYPVVDVRVTVVDGSYHEKDSNAHAFRTAATMAFRDACAKGEVILLEPVGRLEVVIPTSYVGAVIGDLHRRRGRIERQETTTNETVTVGARVPLAETFGYASDLRSLTQGRADFTLQPGGYEEVPANIAAAVANRPR